jgi:crossover junction endodeoxyribonuclease RusA
VTGTWTIRLPYTRPPISLNSRMHWATKARFTREIRSLVAFTARQQRIPAMDSAHIELHWVPRDRRRRDSDNPYPTLKAAIDGLRDARVLSIDDSSEYVTSRVVIDPANPRDPHLLLVLERVQ